MEEERKRTAERAAEAKRAEKAMGMEGMERDASAEIECQLPAPIGWPIHEGTSSGIPHLDLIMQVDIIGKFKFERSLVSFQVCVQGRP